MDHTKAASSTSLPETSFSKTDKSSLSPSPPSSEPGSDVEESLDARIERLGRERPPCFSTFGHEVAFVFSVVMSQALTDYFVSGFNVLLPALIRDLNIPESSSVWPATAFSLVIASTLLLFGRLGDQHGGYIVYICGLVWLAVWSVIAGFSVNALMLDFCRALQGLGAAAFLPTGVMLIGSAYRPGPRKNIVFAIYGTCGVLGFFMGVLFSGIAAQFASWRWYFWIGAILSALASITSFYSISNDRDERKKHQIESDWLGATTIVSGLVLLVFCITELAHAPDGFRTPYIATLFPISILLLLAAIYIEGWVAKRPLLPADIFAVKGMTPLLLSMFLLYGTAAIYLLYGTQYFQTYMGAKPMQIVAWYTPLVLAGLGLAASEGFILHIVPGYALLILSGIGALVSQLLLALVPLGGNFWAWIMPSMVLATVGIDLSITLMMIFVTTTQRLSRQGLAGGLVNSVLHLGMAVTIGVADIIRSETLKFGDSTTGADADADVDRRSLKYVFWFGVAVGGFSLLLMAVWGRIPRQMSDFTADEKVELEREAKFVGGGAATEGAPPG